MKKQINRKKLKWVLVFLHSIVVIVFCYFLWNIPHSLGGASHISTLNAIRNAIGVISPIPEDLLLINVSHDKQLIDVYDDYGVLIGNTDITDREKLIQLFDVLKAGSSYKYIFCDIFFDPNFVTHYDDSLYQLIASMPRLAIPKHLNGDSLSPIIRNKAYYSDYNSDIYNDFFYKYEFIQGDQKSIPLKIWEELTAGEMNKQGLFYFTNGILSNNSIILDMDVQIQNEIMHDGTKNYLNLGEDFLTMGLYLDSTQIHDYVKNKFIVIGNLKDQDIHNTVFGSLQGAIITYNAYLALANGKQIVDYWSWGILFILIFIFSYLAIFEKSAPDFIPKKINLGSKFFKLIEPWFGVGKFMIFMWIIFYILSEQFFDILILILYFAFLNKIVKIYRKLHNHKS